MIKKHFLIGGILSFLAGIFLASNVFQTVTGLIVVREIDKSDSSILGFVLIVGGLLFILLSNVKPNFSDLRGSKDNYSNNFNSSTSALEIITDT